MADSKDHINITLFYQGNRENRMDLRIPNTITVYKFIRELNQIFNRNKELKKYQLKVVNKGLILDEEKRLNDFPVTTGDIIEVLGE